LGLPLWPLIENNKKEKGYAICTHLNDFTVQM